MSRLPHHVRSNLAPGVIANRRLVVRDGAPGCAVEIVELAALQRPEKARKTQRAEPERQRHQINQHFHQRTSKPARRARSAFSITSTDEPDIAIAAINGVARPAIATGTANAL